MEILQNISLKGLNSWHVGGAAQYYAQPSNLEDLKKAWAWAEEKKQGITLLSGGSNVLISDEGVEGLVIHLSHFKGTQIHEANGRLIVEALAGTAKSELLKIFLKHKLQPAIFLAGIPGDVGGGVVMNAGIGEALQPREFVEIIDWVDVLDLQGSGASDIAGPIFKIKRFQRDELRWTYRHCEGWRPGIIVKVGISWPMEPNESIPDTVRLANRTRLQKQPLELPSCGSVFVNPPQLKAGQLIEGAGLRGYSQGDAQVSEKHANFIVNQGQAKAQDIHSVIEHVKMKVFNKTGVRLVTEVVYLGHWPQ